MGQKKTTIQTGTWSPTWGYSLEASASMAQYPTTDNKRNGTNYWVTGSTIIPAGVASFVTASTGLGPVNTSAKVSITSSYFTPLFNSNINDSNDVKQFGILSYNGVISTIAGYNDFSSSTFNNYTQSFVVMHISASKANMGNVVTNDLIVSLGTTQNSSVTRNGNDSTTNVSESMAFATKYPTNTNRTNKGTTYGYPSTTVQRPIGLYVQYPFETNSGSAAYNAPLYDNGVLISSSKQANELRYPNNTTKEGWVGGVSPKNQ